MSVRSSSAVLLFGACVAYVALWSYFHAYTVDDAYISLRYARNLADGHGLVFSTDGSPPVEGYTNFLWVILTSPLFLLRMTDAQILASLKLLGLFFGLGTVFMTFGLTLKVTQDRLTAAISAAPVALMPYLPLWSAAGLETAMCVFLLTAGIFAFVSEERRQARRWGSMALLALAAMTRPEGLPFVLTLVAWELARAAFEAAAGKRERALSRLRALLPGLLVCGIVVGGSCVWRYGFYGSLFPNTDYAKRATFSLSHVMNRLIEMRWFLVHLVPVGALAILGFRRMRADESHERNLLLVCLLAFFAFGFVPRREWMPGYRYELPMLPVLALFAAVALRRYVFGGEAVGAISRHRWARPALALVIVVYLVWPAAGLAESKSYTDKLERAHVALGLWLSRYAPPGASYAGWDMGAAPYFSRLPRIFDIHSEGILCERTQHLGYDIDYFLANRPTFIVLPYLERPEETVTESSWGPLRFYVNEEFQSEYEPLFVLGWDGRLKYALFQRSGTISSPTAFVEGVRIAEASLINER